MKVFSGILALLLMPFAVILLTAAAVSCSHPGNDWSEYRGLPSEGWCYGDTLRFTPAPYDSIATGHLMVAISHEADFGYSQLWLEVLTTDTDGHVSKDTVSFPLSDNYGRWKGTGLATHFQMTDTLHRRVTLVKGVPLKVRHIMQADTLRGISQVGIFLIPD